MNIGVHNPEDYRKEFEETGSVVIRNFLNEEIIVCKSIYPTNDFFSFSVPFL